MTNKIGSLLLAMLVAFATPHSVDAGLLTSLTDTVTYVGGEYDYEYTVDNLLNSTLQTIAFRVEIPSTADVHNITGPSGWLASYVPGATLISWESSAPTFDIGGGSQGRFAFRSALPPGAQGYAILGFEENSFDFEFNQGLATAPAQVAAVPEPTIWPLFLVGLTRFAIRRVKRGGRESNLPDARE